MFADDDFGSETTQTNGKTQHVSVPGPVMDARDFDVNLLALASVSGIGHKTLRKLVDHFGDLERIWHEDTPIVRDLLAEAHVREPKKAAAQITSASGEVRRRGERQRDELARRGIRLFGMYDNEFPDRLRGIPDPPYWLFVQGEYSVLSAPAMVAIVGTRQASSIGRKTAERLSWLVASAGLGVVSGLAEGIDAAAHRTLTTLEVPHVAVLGTGIDVPPFPAATAPYRQALVQQGGALITEYLPGASYNRAYFVERNRLQAGLAYAVCPVEARLKGGTAHTVQFAKRYNRVVFGVRYGTPATTNEMPEYLSAEGHDVIRLDTDEGVEQLKAILDKLPKRGRRQPPRMPPPGDVFKPVIDALNQVESTYTLSPYYRHWLLEELAQHFGKRPAPSEVPEADD